MFLLEEVVSDEEDASTVEPREIVLLLVDGWESGDVNAYPERKCRLMHRMDRIVDLMIAVQCMYTINSMLGVFFAGLLPSTRRISWLQNKMRPMPDAWC